MSIREFVFEANQRIARWIASPWAVYMNATGDGYTDDPRLDLLGENQNADFMVAKRDGEWWESFTVWRFKHLRAAFRTRRFRLANFIEIEDAR